MKVYEKPVVLANEELAEGVYAASGVVDDGPNEIVGTEPSVETPDTEPGGTPNDNTPANNEVKCDSQYMNGTWQGPDYSDWNGSTRGYRQQFGCLGCPAYTGSGCGLESHYVESGNASSYEVDNGNRMPSWERKGYAPEDPVTDWAM